jgi:cation diffusion facilitator CzcD-associated flavoprotein CzcO
VQKVKMAAKVQQQQQRAKFAIIGSGFSGICMGIKLLQAGYHNFTIYEKSGETVHIFPSNSTRYPQTISGGPGQKTVSHYLSLSSFCLYLVSAYPDCGCDVPSPLYSYSFELYPDWDRMWAKQPQILKYMEHVVKKYDLESHLQFKTTMTASVWNEQDNNWKLTLSSPSRGQESEVFVDYLILAVGSLHIPQFPSIKGLSTVDGSSPFLGQSFHAAQWNHSVSLQNKRVGVIGCGASAIQLIPEIASRVKDLYIFQRTPPHVFPKTDFEFPELVKSLFRAVPFLMTLTRWCIFLATELRFGGLYEGSLFNHWMRIDSLRYLKSIVKSPELREKVIPKYTIGCKRMLFSSRWYPTLIRDNVHVINDRLVEVNETGITVQEEIPIPVPASAPCSTVSSNKNIPLDVIVYATGFQLTRDQAPKQYHFEVTGKGGASLNEWHRTDPRTLLGMTAPRFPNLFHLYGPNTNLGHNSIVFMIECQTDYITGLVTQSLKKGYAAVEVKEEAVQSFQDKVIKKGLQGKV